MKHESERRRNDEDSRNEKTDEIAATELRRISDRGVTTSRSR